MELDWGLVRASIPECSKLNDVDFDRFVDVCQRTGLDPMAGQVIPQVRKSKDGPRMSIIVKIDGLRLIAQRSAQYQGQTPAQWCGEDGRWVDVWVSEHPPSAARVGVYRTGFREALVAVATWRAYAPESGTGWWKKGPEHMLSKCAEALALRKAFPQETSGLYTAEEMTADHAGSTTPSVQARPEATTVVADQKPKTQTGQAQTASPQDVLRKFQEIDKTIDLSHLESMFGRAQGWTDETKFQLRALFARTKACRSSFWFDVTLTALHRVDPTIEVESVVDVFGPPETWTPNTRFDAEKLVGEVIEAQAGHLFWDAHYNAVRASEDAEGTHARA